MNSLIHRTASLAGPCHWRHDPHLHLKLRQGVLRLRCCSRSCFRVPRPSIPAVSCRARFSGSGVPILPNLNPRRGRVVAEVPPADHSNALVGAPVFTCAPALPLEVPFVSMRIFVRSKLQEFSDMHDEFGCPYRSKIMWTTIWPTEQVASKSNTYIHRSHSFLVAFDSHVKYFSQHYYWFIWFFQLHHGFTFPVNCKFSYLAAYISI